MATGTHANRHIHGPRQRAHVGGRRGGERGDGARTGPRLLWRLTLVWCTQCRKGKWAHSTGEVAGGNNVGQRGVQAARDAVGEGGSAATRDLYAT
eukprot:4888900-Prymnesium_polylepis.1